MLFYSIIKKINFFFIASAPAVCSTRLGNGKEEKKEHSSSLCATFEKRKRPCKTNREGADLLIRYGGSTDTTTTRVIPDSQDTPTPYSSHVSLKFSITRCEHPTD